MAPQGRERSNLDCLVRSKWAILIFPKPDLKELEGGEESVFKHHPCLGTRLFIQEAVMTPIYEDHRSSKANDTVVCTRLKLE